MPTIKQFNANLVENARFIKLSKYCKKVVKYCNIVNCNAEFVNYLASLVNITNNNMFPIDCDTLNKFGIYLGYQIKSLFDKIGLVEDSDYLLNSIIDYKLSVKSFKKLVFYLKNNELMVQYHIFDNIIMKYIKYLSKIVTNLEIIREKLENNYTSEFWLNKYCVRNINDNLTNIKAHLLA
jgi:hypothetical protein